ncbi:hypothetical protein BDN72DRAFT_835791 [Pluteus cervinus]|uniref:Uncharacterized protein n=1 Tax=Pluteus cervinus TaxID=181527 RepID=A0ACD3B4J2_9AGAR|nr:hypothetical protein BDN72DRAFT_835791 [Pluteus cervinus]
MHDCLNNFNTGSFQNQYWCGGMYWQMGSRWYNSPSDCYNACKNHMAAGIDQGASDQECDDYEGFAECWYQMWRA